MRDLKDHQEHEDKEEEKKDIPLQAVNQIEIKNQKLHTQIELDFQCVASQKEANIHPI